MRFFRVSGRFNYCFFSSLLIFMKLLPKPAKTGMIHWSADGQSTEAICQSVVNNTMQEPVLFAFSFFWSTVSLLHLCLCSFEGFSFTLWASLSICTHWCTAFSIIIYTGTATCSYVWRKTRGSLLIRFSLLCWILLCDSLSTSLAGWRGLRKVLIHVPLWYHEHLFARECWSRTMFLTDFSSSLPLVSLLFFCNMLENKWFGLLQTSIWL